VPFEQAPGVRSLPGLGDGQGHQHMLGRRGGDFGEPLQQRHRALGLMIMQGRNRSKKENEVLVGAIR
jgi:hypothetical protein